MADSPRSLVRVVVPVYRELTPDEESSLRNNVRVLAAWPFTVLHPRGVTPPACCRELGLETRAVGDEWLGRRNGIAGYNRMTLSEEFYASFPDTEYILICHTDAWIFRDELGDWCRRGYDCVAAPWLRRPLYDLPLVKQYMQWRERMKRRRGEASRQVLYGRVGNGGLSLRRVEAFRRACATYRTEAESYLADPCHLHNEDVFWAVVPREFRYPAPTNDASSFFDSTTHHRPYRPSVRRPVGGGRRRRRFGSSYDVVRNGTDRRVRGGSGGVGVRVRTRYRPDRTGTGTVTDRSGRVRYRFRYLRYHRYLRNRRYRRFTVRFGLPVGRLVGT